ncbi:MAG: hypothetical protein IAI50_04385 [Candidatus Eremiobacteraeota bacterium]|nr:hypothetical protein [Candidatus Eremiobacteraeota bacterium]
MGLSLLLAVVVAWPGEAASNRPAYFISANRMVYVYNDDFQEITQFGANGHVRLAIGNDGTLYSSHPYKPLVLARTPPYQGTPLELKIKEQGTGPLQVISVAVAPGTGLVAISSESATHNGGPGGIAFFRKGETKQCNFVKGDMDELSFDSKGVLYYTAAGEETPSYYVGMIRGGCNATTPEPLGFPKQLLPLLLAVDANDNIAIQVLDFTSGNYRLFTYAHPTGKDYGPPISQTEISNRCFLGAFQTKPSGLWEICARAQEIPYPGGGPAIRTFGPKYPDSIVVYPPVHP